MSLYHNKYRIETNRLDCWDYSKYGFYFVTICTHKKKLFFGQSSNDDIMLNAAGKLAEKNWLKIPRQFNSVEIDEFVIMPNHIHGIIFITKNHTTGRDLIIQVSTAAKKQIKNNPMKSKLSLGKIIRWYKGKTTFEIRHQLDQSDFGWQSRYYEHIIRNQKELEKIREYIYINPIKWSINEENPQNPKI